MTLESNEIDKQDDWFNYYRPAQAITFSVDMDFEADEKSSLIERAGSVFKEDFTTKFPSQEEFRKFLQY